ncbi:FixH family protein [uncultured Cytophaga sp.]|uniref:FixH family protein n=1 Tax=uncultured Cytophaga sp. TaxID=160238 RepID=UPI00260EFA5B|nr:FixH family protein [uncultured Cytophaga sp.]
MKLHWGHYIAIFFTCFVVFMLALVYKTFDINTELVAEDYYNREIAYQGKINKQTNTLNYDANVEVVQSNDTVLFLFPVKFEDSLIKGTINIYRPSDIKKDLTIPISVKNKKQFIFKNQLSKGRYIIYVDWQADTLLFYTEKTIDIK